MGHGTKWLCLIGIAVMSLGCGVDKVADSKVVYVQEDVKMLEALTSSAVDSAVQTDLLTQLVDGQKQLIESLSQQGTRRRIGSEAIATSVSADASDDAARELDSSLEVLDTSLTGLEGSLKELESALKEKVKSSADTGWPDGIRLQVWRDGLPDTVKWQEEEVPLLGVQPEYFESIGSLANQYKIGGFTIVLVGTDGKEARRYVNTVPASQILKAAREVKEGKTLVSMGAGRSGTCTCPNCSCVFGCDCESGGTSSNMITYYPSSSITQTQRSGPVSWYPSTAVFTQPQVRSSSTTRTRCVNGRCYQY